MRNPEPTAEPTERLFLVYLNQDTSEDRVVERELEGLVEAAGGEAVGATRQRVSKPYKATYIGSGKVQEVMLYAAETQADVVVLDTELSGIQIRNLEEQLKTRVVDRTQLILDIFASRAHTREGQLQVELAQYSYMLPRLMSVYTKFERQRGGIGMRGPGETKLESDRRMVKHRISTLKAQLEEVKQHRAQQRAGRKRTPFPVVAIAGYTSAGKSTLMNRLCGTHLLADAMPFATLDPTTRKLDLPGGHSVFLTDTVGFIRKLPTHLVAAFRSTLEEVTLADLILHVVDVSSEDWEVQRDTVIETLQELGAQDIPTLTVFNKVDLLDDPTLARRLVAEWEGSVAVSALDGTGIPDLVELMSKRAQTRLGLIRAQVPYDQSALVEACYRIGRVRSCEYGEQGILLEAELTHELRSRLAPYEVKPSPTP